MDAQTLGHKFCLDLVEAEGNVWRVKPPAVPASATEAHAEAK